MPIRTYRAFYPSQPYWAGEAVAFVDPKAEDGFFPAMSAIVYAHDTERLSFRAARDGRILLFVPGLESADAGPEGEPDAEARMRLWGRYLDCLNAAYLIFESTVIERTGSRHFRSHEITLRDAFLTSYDGDRLASENIATESIASVFQMARLTSYHGARLPPPLDPAISPRPVVPIEAIDAAARKLDEVLTLPGATRALASFLKSISEYKAGNFETSAVLSWFIIESAITAIWARYLERVEEGNGEKKRFNRARKAFLTGRSYTAGIIANTLELVGEFSHEQFAAIDKVREVRNRIVHGRSDSLGIEQARLAIAAAHGLIQTWLKLKLSINLAPPVTA